VIETILDRVDWCSPGFDSLATLNMGP
jgi:hypothetical protein